MAPLRFLCRKPSKADRLHSWSDLSASHVVRLLYNLFGLTSCQDQHWLSTAVLERVGSLMRSCYHPGLLALTSALQVHARWLAYYQVQDFHDIDHFRSHNDHSKMGVASISSGLSSWIGIHWMPTLMRWSEAASANCNPDIIAFMANSKFLAYKAAVLGCSGWL